MKGSSEFYAREIKRVEQQATCRDRQQRFGELSDLKYLKRDVTYKRH